MSVIVLNNLPTTYKHEYINNLQDVVAYDESNIVCWAPYHEHGILTIYHYGRNYCVKHREVEIKTNFPTAVRIMCSKGAIFCEVDDEATNSYILYQIDTSGSLICKSKDRSMHSIMYAYGTNWLGALRLHLNAPTPYFSN